MKERHEQAFAYDDWANRRAVEMLRSTPGVEERARRALAHTVVTPQVWLARIEQRPSTWTDFWPDLTLDECEQQMAETRRLYAAFFAGLTDADLARAVPYTNSRGEAFETPTSEILRHVAFHGGYHRGQVAAAVRAAGGTPLNTDYIVYYRGR